MTELTHETAEWADGPLLAAWLAPRLAGSFCPSSVGRAMSRWREPGTVAEFWTVDRVLTAVDIHPMDLPVEVWRGPPPHKSRKPPVRRSGAYAKRLSPADVLDIRRRARSTMRKDLAAEFGVSPRTIANVANGWTWAHVKEPAA